MDAKVAKDLIKTRNIVRRKFRALKSDIAKAQTRIDREYRPVTEPLKELVRTIKNEPPFIKREQTSPIPKRISTPTRLPAFLRDEEVFESSEPNQSIIIEPTQEFTRADLLNMTKQPFYQTYLEVFDPLVRKYVDESIRDVDNRFDHVHGLKHDIDTEKWMIGNTPVDFDGPNLKLLNLVYRGTPGLYELLFKKNPAGYTQEDVKQYMDILARTNTYKRNYDPNEQIQGTTNIKYLDIIKPYLQQKGLLKSSVRTRSQSLKISGKGVKLSKKRGSSQPAKLSGKGALLNLSKKRIDYVYYDDVNEIVERLRILVASQRGGNNGHNNEILSILEELREANVII